jgi:phosphoglycolate phosphatase
MKLVLFDCDGTLADSQGSITRAMDEAFVKAGLTPPGRLRTRQIVGLSVPEAIRALAPNAVPDQQILIATEFRAAAQRIRLMTAEDPLFDGADVTVRAFAGRNDLVLGLATGKSRRGVDRLLAHHSWESCFATLQTADGNPSKPHPGMIDAACAETGLSAADTIMIGDTTYDIEMARAAGARAIGVAWGYHPVEALRQAGAETIVPDFAALRTLIG